MKRVLEREISKKWISSHLALHPGDYAHRIVDTPWGGAKPFDWFLFCGNDSIALEFKVDRRKNLLYSILELPLHQKKALEGFANGKNRRSKVMVFHMVTESWHELEVK